jgi:hypothetical protein
MFSRSRFRNAVLILSLAVSLPAFGITINDTATPGYITGMGSYTGVVKILFSSFSTPGTFICSGSLLPTGMHILTAGHCVDDAFGWTVTFETAAGTTTLGTVAAALHPLYGPRPAPIDQLSEYDIAVLTLDSVAPATAERYDVKFDLSGVTTASIIDIVGYGLGGNPTVGHLGTGTRRHAVNTIDGLIGSLSGVPTPDLPFAMFNFFGADPPEHGLINGGDSGGPAFFMGDILGVASFGNLPRPPDPFSPGVYFTGHATLFDDATVAFLAPFVVPEPGTLTLVGIGVLAIWRKRRAA